MKKNHTNLLNVIRTEIDFIETVDIYTFFFFAIITKSLNNKIQHLTSY